MLKTTWKLIIQRMAERHPGIDEYFAWIFQCDTIPQRDVLAMLPERHRSWYAPRYRRQYMRHHTLWSSRR